MDPVQVPLEIVTSRKRTCDELADVLCMIVEGLPTEAELARLQEEVRAGLCGWPELARLSPAQAKRCCEVFARSLGVAWNYARWVERAAEQWGAEQRSERARRGAATRAARKAARKSSVAATTSEAARLRQAIDREPADFDAAAAAPSDVAQLRQAIERELAVVEPAAAAPSEVAQLREAIDRELSSAGAPASAIA
ncbi:MAG: hypothetical protein ACYC5O_03825 [Anaerolineae bacterium]